MLTGENTYLYVYGQFQNNVDILAHFFHFNLSSLLSFNPCRKYKLEEVNKHELLKCHCNCVRFIKAWEERLARHEVFSSSFSLWIKYLKIKFRSLTFWIMSQVIGTPLEGHAALEVQRYVGVWTYTLLSSHTAACTVHLLRLCIQILSCTQCLKNNLSCCPIFPPSIIYNLVVPMW